MQGESVRIGTGGHSSVVAITWGSLVERASETLIDWECTIIMEGSMYAVS